MHVALRRCFSSAAAPRAAIDVHTHVYLPRYLKVLRERTAVPRVFTHGDEDRLVILPGEDDEASTSAGRPIGTEYSDPKRKIAFMDTHNIAVSVLSLANPWLEFTSGAAAATLASSLNADLQEQCEKSNGRFYGFGVLPSDDADASCLELERLAQMDKMRGVIVSAKGLDDPRNLPVYQVAEKLGMVLFVHPHNGVGNEFYGGFGHALFLALGFPFETTVAVRPPLYVVFVCAWLSVCVCMCVCMVVCASLCVHGCVCVQVARLVCSGMLDQVPDLKLLVSHTGGTLPFLAGRLDSCVAGDEHLAGVLKHAPSHYLKARPPSITLLPCPLPSAPLSPFAPPPLPLPVYLVFVMPPCSPSPPCCPVRQKFYYDAISYHEPTLLCASSFVGPENLMFGTDHPFFPPPRALVPPGGSLDTVLWKSTTSNANLIGSQAPEIAAKIFNGNAQRLLNIKLP